MVQRVRAGLEPAPRDPVGSALPRRAFLLAAAAGACLSACGRSPRPGTDRPLVVVFSPAHAPRKLEPLRAALERASGLRLDLRVAATSGAAIDLVQSHGADAGLLPLFDYLFCAEVLGVEPLAQVLRGAEGASYEGELVVRADGPIADLAALSGQPVGFVDRYSVTGFLLPAKLLRDARVAVKPVWLGTHEAALEALRAGRVQAAATYKDAVEGKPAFRVLARAPRIANEPLFAQHDLAPAVRDALRKAFVEAAGGLLEGVAGASAFRAVDASEYTAALATVRAAGQAVEDLVPGGWSRANERRRPLWSYAP